jgi:GNAT superfamily N-acetyltransferase
MADPVPAVTAVEPDPAGFAPLAARSLTFDGAEAAQILTRLANPPAGRHAVWLRAGDAGVALVSRNGTDSAVAHVDLLAVDPGSRRRGIGTALLHAAEQAAAGFGARELRFMGNPPCYAWPGIDVRYTPAICLVEAAGYERFRTAQNMVADLTTADLSTVDDEERLAGQGVSIRQATPDEVPALRSWAERVFNATWAWEIEQSVLAPGAGCHVAWRDGAVLAFAGHGANRPSWFGPMGTDPDARNLGLGKVLLRRCLAAQRDAGLDSAQIGWVGPIPFYSRTVGARVDRIFWLYRKEI